VQLRLQHIPDESVMADPKPIAKAVLAVPGRPHLAARSRLITLISGGAAVLYAVLVFLPQQQAIHKLRQKIKERDAEVARSLRLSDLIHELTERLHATEQFTAQWKSQAPPASHVTPVFAELIRHAKTAGAEIVSLSPQTELPLETIGRTPVSLQVRGSYRSLHELLQRVEEMQGVVWIDELNLQPQASGDKPLGCTLKLMIFSNRGEISG
jgi:Tfp pilus assembly protein PilO